MDKEQAKAKLLEMFPDKRISCAEATRFAKEWGIELKAMGQILNDAGIKLAQCQLGCF